MPSGRLLRTGSGPSLLALTNSALHRLHALFLSFVLSASFGRVWMFWLGVCVADLCGGWVWCCLGMASEEYKTAQH